MTPRKFLAWVFASAITVFVCLGVVLIVFDFYQGAFPRLTALTSIKSALGQAFLVAGVAAIPATVLVILLQATRGQLEFSALGVRFRGPSGPLLLWSVVFLVVSAVILGTLVAAEKKQSREPLKDYPIVSLHQPIEEQVQLFATDKVIIHGGEGNLQEVWLGNQWEPYMRDRTYIVWGISGVPVIPRFRAVNREGGLKLEISYTANIDKPRDVRNASRSQR